MTRVLKLTIYVFAAWFVWMSWRGVPYFSRGFGEGVDFYRREVSELLDEFAAAGGRMTRAMRVRVESLGYPSEKPEVSKSPNRFAKLEG